MAALTHRIRIGTLCAGVMSRDPATLAKAAAMVAQISGGDSSSRSGRLGQSGSSFILRPALPGPGGAARQVGSSKSKWIPLVWSDWQQHSAPRTREPQIARDELHDPGAYERRALKASLLFLQFISAPQYIRKWLAETGGIATVWGVTPTVRSISSSKAAGCPERGSGRNARHRYWKPGPSETPAKTSSPIASPRSSTTNPIDLAVSPVPPGEATATCAPSGSRNKSASTPSTSVGLSPIVVTRNRVISGRSWTGATHPRSAQLVLDMALMDAVIEHLSDDLVARVQAGTTLGGALCRVLPAGLRSPIG